MHILKPIFEMERDNALCFASARGFGVVVAADGDGPRGSHVPFVIQTRDDGSVVVQIHFTAKNHLFIWLSAKIGFLSSCTGRTPTFRTTGTSRAIRFRKLSSLMSISAAKIRRACGRMRRAIWPEKRHWQVSHNIERRRFEDEQAMSRFIQGEPPGP